MAWKSLGKPVDYSRWRRLRKKLFQARGRRCQRCGKGAGRFEVDHIRPISQGGDFWEEKNLQILCRRCHIKKTYQENPKVGPQARKWKIFFNNTIKELD